MRPSARPNGRRFEISNSATPGSTRERSGSSSSRKVNVGFWVSASTPARVIASLEEAPPSGVPPEEEAGTPPARVRELLDRICRALGVPVTVSIAESESGIVATLGGSGARAPDREARANPRRDPIPCECRPHEKCGAGHASRRRDRRSRIPSPPPERPRAPGGASGTGCSTHGSAYRARAHELCRAEDRPRLLEGAAAESRLKATETSPTASSSFVPRSEGGHEAGGVASRPRLHAWPHRSHRCRRGAACPPRRGARGP